MSFSHELNWIHSYRTPWQEGRQTKQNKTTWWLPNDSLYLATAQNISDPKTELKKMHQATTDTKRVLEKKPHNYIKYRLPFRKNWRWGWCQYTGHVCHMYQLSFRFFTCSLQGVQRGYKEEIIMLCSIVSFGSCWRLLVLHAFTWSTD